MFFFISNIKFLLNGNCAEVEAKVDVEVSGGFDRLSHRFLSVVMRSRGG